MSIPESRLLPQAATVARELAANGYQTTLINGISPAEYALKTKPGRLAPEELDEFERDAWWAQLWRDPTSPYQLVTLTRDEVQLSREIVRAFDRACFVAPTWAPLAEHNDALIVAEALAKNAKLLLTSNMRSIRRSVVNDWAERSGEKLGFIPQRVVTNADATLLRWSLDPTREDRLLQAALMACWPSNDKTSTTEIIKTTMRMLTAMAGGRLPATARRLAKRLGEHPNQRDLIKRTRQNLPSLTIETDRDHPTHPKRASGPWLGVRAATPKTKSWLH